MGFWCCVSCNCAQPCPHPDGCLVSQSATMLLNAGQALARTFRRGRSYGDYQFSLDAYAFPSEGQLIRAWFRLLSFIS